MMKHNCKGNRKYTNKKLFFTNTVTYLTNIAGTFASNTLFTKTIDRYSKFSLGGGGDKRGERKFTASLEKRLEREKKEEKEFHTRIQTPWPLALLSTIELK